MALQAFIDDSYSPDGVLVLAGFMATDETWASFSRAWERTLQWGLRDERGWYFHMTEMAANPERMARVGAFWRVVEEHDLLCVCSKLNISDLRRAIDRIWVLQHRIDFNSLAHPHVMAFVALVESLYKQRNECSFYIPETERIDFILDQHSQEKFMIRFWNDFIGDKPEEVNIEIGNLPRFRDDREFLPLQAADLAAWWFRRWYEEGRILPTKLDLEFDGWKSQVPLRLITIDNNEDQIVDKLKSYIRSTAKKDVVIYDSKYSSSIL